MTDIAALASQSRTTWISEAEWRELLRDSNRLQDQIRELERRGKRTAHLWEALRPINEAIRSPLVKVSGIDDLTTEERREKAMARSS